MCKYLNTDTLYCSQHEAHITAKFCEKVCSYRWPNKLELAKNFAKAVTRRARRIENRSDEEIAAIFKICQKCERFEENNGRPRCRHVKCGCFLLNKIKWVTEHCPEGKW